MAIAKRCPFCRQKLDKNGYCQNTQCIDYPRTKMHEEEEEKKKKEQEEQGDQP